MKKLIMLILLCCSVRLVQAQQINWHVFSDSDTLANVALCRLDGDSLLITDSGDSLWVHVESIRVIRTMKRSKVGRGIGMAVPEGLAVGATVGAIWGSKDYGKPGPHDYWGYRFDIGKRNTAIITGIVGGLAGGGLGALIGGGIGKSKNKVFKLHSQSYEQKLQTIWTILTLYN